MSNSDNGTSKLRADNYRLREQGSLLITFGSGFILLILSNYAGEFFRGIGLAGYSTLGHLIRDVGIALLVGGYIAMTIERRSKRQTQDEIREYIHEVGDKIIGTVYGQDIPDDLFETVKTTTLQQPFIRKQYANRITLHDFTEEYVQTLSSDIRNQLERFREEISPDRTLDDLVVFRTVTKFEVENVSPLSATHEFTYALDVAFPDHPSGLAGINSVKVDDVQIEERIYTVDHVNGQNDTSMLWYRRQEEIPAGRTKTFEVHSFSLKLTRDKEAWFFPYPQHGAWFDVEDLDGNKDIEIALRAPSPSGEMIVSYKDRRTNTAALRVDQYLLPYQAIDIKWWPS